MKRYVFGLAAAVAAITFSPGLQAAPLGAAGGLGAAADAAAIGETVQYFWGGNQYCWYDGGWRGPGWYRCGFAWRRGYGWGGPMGWRGWSYRAPPRVFYGPGPRRVGPPPRPIYRPGPGFRPGPGPGPRPRPGPGPRQGGQRGVPLAR